MLCSFMGGVSFPGVSAPVVRWSRTEGYTAFSSFTHLLTLPLAKGGNTLTEFVLRGKNQCDTYREAYLERAARTTLVVGECTGPVYYVREQPR